MQSLPTIHKTNNNEAQVKSRVGHSGFFVPIYWDTLADACASLFLGR